MIALTVVLLVIGGVILYLLCAPVVLEIDSVKRVGQVRLYAIARARIRISDEGGLWINVYIAGWKKSFDLLSAYPKPTKPRTKKNASKKKRKTRLSLRKLLAVLRSFKVTRWKVIIDTGDMALNGKLFPWLYLISSWTGKTCRISFNNNSVIQMRIQNSMGRMLWAYLKPG